MPNPVVTRSALRSKDDQTDLEDSDDVASINDLWKKMKSLLSESNSRLETKIDACKNSIDGLETKLAALRDECEYKVNCLHETVGAVQNEVHRAADEIARLEKSEELLISGIPYQPTENLLLFFRDIATGLGYEATNLPIVDLKRLAKLPIVTGSSPPILCQFALRNNRDDFYRKYMTNRNLSLRHLGFAADNRVYINENLTRLSRDIRAEAIKLKKTGSLEQVYTRNGAIYVKRRGATEAEVVRSVEELSLKK